MNCDGPVVGVKALVVTDVRPLLVSTFVVVPRLVPELIAVGVLRRLVLTAVAVPVLTDELVISVVPRVVTLALQLPMQ